MKEQNVFEEYWEAFISIMPFDDKTDRIGLFYAVNNIIMPISEIKKLGVDFKKLKPFIPKLKEKLDSMPLEDYVNELYTAFEKVMDAKLKEHRNNKLN